MLYDINNHSFSCSNEEYESLPVVFSTRANPIALYRTHLNESVLAHNCVHYSPDWSHVVSSFPQVWLCVVCVDETAQWISPSPWPLRTQRLVSALTWPHLQPRPRSLRRKRRRRKRLHPNQCWHLQKQLDLGHQHPLYVLTKALWVESPVRFL